jgi:hypothetical protein
MLVKMLLATGGPNGTACFVGEVHDLPDALAQQWVLTGRAVVVSDDAPAPVVAVQHAEPPKRKRR